MKWLLRVLVLEFPPTDPYRLSRHDSSITDWDLELIVEWNVGWLTEDVSATGTVGDSLIQEQLKPGLTETRRPTLF